MKWDNSGPIGRPPICPKRPKIWGPKYQSWHFFHLTVPLSIWILYKKLLKNFQICPFWANWQTPYWGPKQWIGNFFHKNWSPLNLGWKRKLIEKLKLVTCRYPNMYIIPQISNSRRGAWNLANNMSLQLNSITFLIQ